MQELESRVILEIKNQIATELPKEGYVDGPWKIVAKRMRQKMKHADVSNDAL